jgi:hypothetical protein
MSIIQVSRIKCTDESFSFFHDNTSVSIPYDSLLCCVCGDFPRYRQVQSNSSSSTPSEKHLKIIVCTLVENSEISWSKDKLLKSFGMYLKEKDYCILEKNLDGPSFSYSAYESAPSLPTTSTATKTNDIAAECLYAVQFVSPKIIPQGPNKPPLVEVEMSPHMIDLP